MGDKRLKKSLVQDINHIWHQGRLSPGSARNESAGMFSCTPSFLLVPGKVVRELMSYTTYSKRSKNAKAKPAKIFFDRLMVR